ncbi:MAG: proline--tRNA ligase [Verrucomicrobia bacterium]|nr:proline--tRNA ligase [Verrucomicrobiota bacterium]
MRWTKSLIPTLRESPAEAEILSHQLLLRAGIIRKLAAGLYNFMPLGMRSLRKVQQIVREEMDRAGALEILMPALQPPEIWQKSGRYDAAGDTLFKVNDHGKREWVLGPTHEEVVTTLAAGEISSYRQLPINLYQIQTKFRDEIRPRFGLMRAREFIMKDAYSFDLNDEASMASYRLMYDTYTKIFRRCGLKAFPVEADAGVMGGKHTHEFVVPADTGECEIAFCDTCGYAANVEKADSQVEASYTKDTAVAEAFETPGVKTIEDLSKAPFNIPASQQIKTLIFTAEDKPAILLLRGDYQLNEAKLAGILGTVLFRPATDEEIVALMGAHPGSLGAVGVNGTPIYADLLLQGASGMVTGANKDGQHLRHVDIARDIPLAKFVDIRTVKDGEACPKCGKPLCIRHAIEVGQVFKLGTKYSVALGAVYSDEKGEQKPCVMGCYGIGVTRTLQAIIEQNFDKDGINWPMSVAPYQVCITPLNITADSEPMKWAEKFYAELTAAGIEVLMDDRDERPGVKFKDSELIGIPLRLAIGEKSLAKGVVELKRRGGDLITLKPEEAVAEVIKLVKEELQKLQ